MNVRWSSAALAAAVLFGQKAWADESRSFRLNYSAPLGCPSEEAFASAIQSNSARVRRAGSGEAAVDMNVSIASTNGGYRGALRIRRLDGTESERTVPAATCAEAVSGMALIAAIELDPDAQPSAPLESGVVPEPAPTSVVAAPTATASTPPVESVPPPPRIESPPAVVAEKPSELSSVGSTRRSFWLEAGASVGLASGMAPDFSPDVGVGVGVGSTWKGLWSPLVLLSGHLAESPDASQKEGTSQFQRLALRVTGCPLAGNIWKLTLRPCALFEVGQLAAKGSGTVPAASALSPKILWVELGAVVRGEVTLVGPLTLAADLGAVFPLVRDSFYFLPKKAPVYEIPWVGFAGAIEIGVRFL